MNVLFEIQQKKDMFKAQSIKLYDL